MVATNFAYAKSLPGLLKAVTLLIGLIVMITMFVGQDLEERFEKVYFGSILTIYLVSLIYYILHLVFKALTLSKINVGIDIFFHLIFAILLVISAAFFIVSARRLRKWDNTVPDVIDSVDKSKYAAKITSASFAIINSIFYILAAVFTLAHNPDDSDAPYPEPYMRTQQTQELRSPQQSINPNNK